MTECSLLNLHLRNVICSDSPVLWIRVDPDMLLIRSLDVQQPDFQWQYQGGVHINHFWSYDSFCGVGAFSYDVSSLITL